MTANMVAIATVPHNEVTDPSACPWERVDAAWYRATYMRGRIPGEPTDPEEHYAFIGAASGFSPNPYFNEAYYLTLYPDVHQAVVRGDYNSGFAHYCSFGYHDRSPHWLFSEAHYRANRPDLTDTQLAQYELRNGYHHFLIAGQYEEASGSTFFEVAMCREAFGNGMAPFTALLTRRFEIEPQVSVYFDPLWYLAMYPVVVDLIAGGEYSSALHHFLTNPTPWAFSPIPEFDEGFYRRANPDIVAEIEAGRYRSGVDHFVQYGRQEGRRPSLWFDPVFYNTHRRVRADMKLGHARSGFDHYLRIGRALGLAATPPAYLTPVAENDGKTVFARMARLLARHAIRFTPPITQTPDVSVVVVAFNQFELTMQTLLSVSGSTGVSFEVILVDNASTDEICRIEAHVSGIRLVRNETNHGFLRAANQGMAAARGRHVLLLNNDVTLPPDALERAARRLDGDAGIGAVGGMVVRSHGLLQEAGSIVFRDGSCHGYGRDGDPCAPEYNFVRDVDYCSGVFLMLPNAVMDRLGGLDTAYAPAYYEETDLCARVWGQGLRVVYDPAVVIIHLEYGSSRNPDAPIALMRRNRRVLLSRQREFLQTKRMPDPAMILHARTTIRRKRVLVVEDVIPYRHTGSGFGRTADIVASLVELGCDVSVLPLNPALDTPADRRHGFDERVELLWDRDITTAAAFLTERETYYDVIWVCRAHNLSRIAAVLGGSWGALRHAHVMLDTEALGANREAVRAQLDGTRFDLQSALHRELRDSHLAHAVCAVSHAEAEQLREAGLPTVHVLGHTMECAPTPRPFADRRDILALGSLLGVATPNFDGLAWFIAEVWPIVSETLPDVRLKVAGFVGERVDLGTLLSGERIDHLGFVPDPRELYDTVRVFVAPTRFAAGIPFKVHEAAAQGVPVVATRLLAEQLGWQNDAVRGCDPTDPARFAADVIALYRNEILWTTTRTLALERIATDCSPAGFTATIGRIIAAGVMAG